MSSSSWFLLVCIVIHSLGLQLLLPHPSEATPTAIRSPTKSTDQTTGRPTVCRVIEQIIFRCPLAWVWSHPPAGVFIVVLLLQLQRMQNHAGNDGFVDIFINPLTFDLDWGSFVSGLLCRSFASPQRRFQWTRLPHDYHTTHDDAQCRPG